MSSEKYKVARGPVSPPASEYGPIGRLEEGTTVVLRTTPWLRQALRDGRLEPVEAIDKSGDKPRKRSKKP